ncbi:MAG: hypothetical protein R3E95_17605 [Thiolinea sp.]
MLSSGQGLENNRFAAHYSGTFEALANPWQNSATNPFIDNPTQYGDFSDGHPGNLLLALSLIEALVARISNDLQATDDNRGKGWG